MDSQFGLLIQLAGVSLITLLTLFLRRSLGLVALKHWTHAWLFLCCALFCLRLASTYQVYSTQLTSFFFLTQYIYGFLIFAGCRSLGTKKDLPIREEILVLPFIAIAFALPFVSQDPNFVFNLHALILAGFFGVSFAELWLARIGTFGWKVMLLALGALVIDFVQYFTLFTLRDYASIPEQFFAYNSIFDLVLQILLAFGMVIILLELVLSDAKSAHERLQRAHEQLEKYAHIDPLTTALNRHAFYGYLKRRNADSQIVTGSVGFFDVDNLKSINDMYGHGVGDGAIRAAARAIRESIRAEDLIFRWGGDEFFVIMMGLDAAAAERRFARIDVSLSELQIENAVPAMSIGLSFAFVDFNGISQLESAIDWADAKMYEKKQQRKALLSPAPEPAYFAAEAAAENRPV